jgi:DNA topoisomerase-1
VWICGDPRGHIQATGIDARGRKQYRYHNQWTSVRNQVKFDHMLEFARALPKIRQQVRRDLRRRGVPREKVLACIVSLMDQALIRVGNDEYARHNDSYGLTTIRRQHVSVNGGMIKFNFKGKSGQKIETTINDPRAAKVVRQCQELPGQEVFEYVDDQGESHDVGSEHVNEYLYKVTGKRFTAKDFRTWAGTVVAAKALYGCGPSASRTKRVSDREVRKCCSEAVEKAAQALGNRVATCRKFYVHPKLADCYADGSLEQAFRKRSGAPHGLCTEERAVARLLTMLNGKS